MLVRQWSQHSHSAGHHTSSSLERHAWRFPNSHAIARDFDDWLPVMSSQCVDRLTGFNSLHHATAGWDCVMRGYPRSEAGGEKRRHHDLRGGTVGINCMTLRHGGPGNGKACVPNPVSIFFTFFHFQRDFFLFMM